MGLRGKMGSWAAENKAVLTVLARNSCWSCWAAWAVWRAHFGFCVGLIGLVGQEILQQIQDKPREESKLVGWYTAGVPDFAWLELLALNSCCFTPSWGAFSHKCFLLKFSQPGDKDLICKDLFTCQWSIKVPDTSRWRAWLSIPDQLHDWDPGTKTQTATST